MSKVIQHPRVIAVVFGSLALGLALVWLAVLSVSSPMARATEDAPPAPASAQEVQLYLHRVGLSPKALAAAGVDAADASLAVTAAAEYICGNIANLRAADEAVTAATTQVDTLRGRVQSGLASQQDLEDLAGARTTLHNADAARDALLANVLQEAAEHLSGPQLASLAALKAAPIRSELPLGAVSRSDEQWLAIRTALAIERITAGQETPEGECQDLLDAVRGEPAVLDAAEALSLNLNDVQDSWNQAIAGVFEP